MNVPGVTAAIAGVEHGASEEEVVAVRIARVDAEVPVASFPVQGAVEVGGGNERVPLPVEQHVAQVLVAALPVGAVDIVVARHPHQVVQVNLVGGLVLFVRQVQLVGHLVGEEQCFVACLFVTHCLARCCYCQQCYQGYHRLLHHHEYLFVHDAKLRRKQGQHKGFSLNKRGISLLVSVRRAGRTVRLAYRTMLTRVRKIILKYSLMLWLLMYFMLHLIFSGMISST